MHPPTYFSLLLGYVWHKRSVRVALIQKKVGGLSADGDEGWNLEPKKIVVCGAARSIAEGESAERLFSRTGPTRACGTRKPQQAKRFLKQVKRLVGAETGRLNGQDQTV